MLLLSDIGHRAVSLECPGGKLEMEKVETGEHWGTRLGFIFAIIGAMVGSGNIWRFPRMMAMYGGGAFLIPYSIALFTVAIPLLISEGIIGRETGNSTILGFAKYAGKKYAWLGAWVAWVNIAIMFYYAVVNGWALAYFVKGLTGLYASYAPGKGLETWNAFIGGWQPLFFTILVWLFTWYVMAVGVKRIEKVATFMVPSLILFLVVVIIRAVTMPGADVGLTYMFKFDTSKLSNAEAWLQAYSQVLWSTGAGWGIYLTYSSYLKKNDDINLNSHITGFGDTSAALLGGLAVITTVAVTAPLIGIDPFKVYAEGNVGLTFIWLTELFPKVPAGFAIGTLFYLALFFAAFTSQIAITDVFVKNVVDFGIPRKKAATYVAIIGLIAGIPAAIKIGWLDNQDWVWGDALLISAVVISFIMLKTGLEKNREIANRGSDIKIGKWWDIMIGYIAPLSIIVVLLWWIKQSINWYPETWWKPTETFSTGTVIFQWIIAAIAIWIIVNKMLMPKIEARLAEEGA